MFFTVPECLVLCSHWVSFPRCRHSVAFPFLTAGQMERFQSQPSCTEVGLGWVSAWVALAAKLGLGLPLQLSTGCPLPPLALVSFCTHLLSAFSPFFFQWQLLYVCKHKGPKMSFCLSLKLTRCSHFESPLHLPHVWVSATLWLMIVLCLTCCWIFLKNTFFIFN